MSSTDKDFTFKSSKGISKSGANLVDSLFIQSIIRSAPSTTGILHTFLSLAFIKPSLIFKFSKNFQAGAWEIVIYASSEFFDAKRVEFTTLTAKRIRNRRQTKSISSVSSG